MTKTEIDESAPTLDPLERDREIAAMRQRSGSFNSMDPLTALFYVLMRDQMPAGELETLVKDACRVTEICAFTNGWLATYAQDLAVRIYQAGEKSIKR